MMQQSIILHPWKNLILLYVQLTGLELEMFMKLFYQCIAFSLSFHHSQVIIMYSELRIATAIRAL